MNPIPLPSHIHYELLLQLLERQTLFAADHKSGAQEQVQQLIITLRKALSQQKRLEETCERHQIPVEYRWSLNHPQTEDSRAQDRRSTLASTSGAGEKSENI